MDGFQVMDALAERKIDWPVIVMTGHGEVPVAVRAMKLGAVDFIEKPFSEQALLGCFAHAFALLKDREAAGRRRRDAHERAASLTAREKEVLQSLLAGQSNKEIAPVAGHQPEDGRDAPRQHDGPAAGGEPRRGAHPRARSRDHAGRAAGRLSHGRARQAADRIAALETELARLAASESMYRTAMELSGRMAWAADAGGAVIVMRSALLDCDRRREDEALGEGWLGIVHPDDRDRVRQAWRAAAASGETYDCEFRARRADGIVPPDALARGSAARRGSGPSSAGPGPPRISRTRGAASRRAATPRKGCAKARSCTATRWN